MSTCKITIPYTPKPKSSVRIGKYGSYNPSSKGMLKTRQYVKEMLKELEFPMMKGPLLVIVHYRIPAPLSLPGKRRRLQNCLPHVKKPDGDNLEKFLNDALNGIIWDDDARIAWLLRSKSLSDAKEGETVVFVRELDNTAPDYELIVSDILEHIKIGESNVSI